MITNNNNVIALAEEIRNKLDRGLVVIDAGAGTKIIKVIDRWELYEARGLVDKLIAEAGNTIKDS